MEDVISFFKENFPENTRFVFPQFDRTEKLDFQYVPEGLEEFLAIVEKAPFKILYGFGFRIWDTMNTLILENQKRPVTDNVSIPIINVPGKNFTIDVGRGDAAPTQLLDVDEDIMLFPGEWYSIIPDGFVVTGLHGEQFPFEKDKTDDDTRFGCLSYGIRRKTESPESDETSNISTAK